MIIVRLKGGVGNQLFQYALGGALQKHYGVPVSYDISKYKNDPLRKFELHALDPNIAEEGSIRAFFSPSLMERIKGKLKAKQGNEIIKEQPKQEWRFNGDIFKMNGRSLYLDGYWQSPRYFELFQTDLRKQFAQLIIPEQSTMGDNYVNSVAIHVRRGDYVNSNLTSEIYSALPLAYYQSAINLMEASNRNLKFYLFSDDLSWCREHFKNVNVSFMENSDSPLFDLALMSRMEHHIIANSTFSWWAAWLNENPSKIVVAPKQWFKDSNMNESAKELIPESWIRV